jgi:hypothetical protein
MEIIPICSSVSIETHARGHLTSPLMKKRELCNEDCPLEVEATKWGDWNAMRNFRLAYNVFSNQ